MKQIYLVWLVGIFFPWISWAGAQELVALREFQTKDLSPDKGRELTALLGGLVESASAQYRLMHPDEVSQIVKKYRLTLNPNQVTLPPDLVQALRQPGAIWFISGGIIQKEGKYPLLFYWIFPLAGQAKEEKFVFRDLQNWKAVREAIRTSFKSSTLYLSGQSEIAHPVQPSPTPPEKPTVTLVEASAKTPAEITPAIKVQPTPPEVRVPQATPHERTPLPEQTPGESTGKPRTPSEETPPEQVAGVPFSRTQPETVPPTQPEPTVEETPAKPALDEHLGWFGETMPEGLRRAGEQGIYLWTKGHSQMVYVPEGIFWNGMEDTAGEEDEQPARQVALSAYYLDRYEVTNAQFCDFLNDVKTLQNPSGERYLDLTHPECRIMQTGSVFLPKPGYAEHPVIKVSWYGAMGYAQWAGKSLPTEAQWEKASRGGLEVPDWAPTSGPMRQQENHLSRRPYPWGVSLPQSGAFRANYNPGVYQDDGYRWLAPVTAFGLLGSSPYGCVNMAGNVWEWCLDWYSPNYYQSTLSPRDPTGPADEEMQGYAEAMRSCRGGSWGSNALRLRCAARHAAPPQSTNNDLGMRCCLPVNKEKK